MAEQDAPVHDTLIVNHSTDTAHKILVNALEGEYEVNLWDGTDLETWLVPDLHETMDRLIELHRAVIRESPDDRVTVRVFCDDLVGLHVLRESGSDTVDWVPCVELPESGEILSFEAALEEYRNAVECGTQEQEDEPVTASETQSATDLRDLLLGRVGSV